MYSTSKKSTFADEAKVDNNKMNSIKPSGTGRSALFLIFSNLMVIVYAVIAKWAIQDVMWIYWAQSVIIGCFNGRRILDLKQFSTKGLIINGRPAKPTRQTQRKSAWFFMGHYQFFHLLYFVALIKMKMPLSIMHFLGISVCVLIFLINHGYSYWHNLQRDMHRKPNLGTMIFFPYARIIPMHLTILFGHFFAKDSGGELILFLVLKTLADVIMHKVEHAYAKR